ncbi:transposase [Streptomyces sp. HUAS TT20]|uniref:transposase n=1 Tax=Streptomyces sp. HUAS TT20 TaxID=3447509 RepID=UPI0021D9035B|nr:transposase [Streptomyces sp. HUAS 15-9]UXY32190.1 transposase [Streptomyces sp. HUAS 15-9]
MGSKQRTYDSEFREGAVHIVIGTEKPIPEVAEELGVHPGTLHSWVSRWRRNGSASSDRPATPAVSGGWLRDTGLAELERLRREMGSGSWRWSAMSSNAAWVRHEVLCDRVVVPDRHRPAVAAVR